MSSVYLNPQENHTNWFNLLQGKWFQKGETFLSEQYFSAVVVEKALKETSMLNLSKLIKTHSWKEHSGTVSQGCEHLTDKKLKRENAVEGPILEHGIKIHLKFQIILINRCLNKNRCFFWWHMDRKRMVN